MATVVAIGSVALSVVLALATVKALDAIRVDQRQSHHGIQIAIFNEKATRKVGV